MVVTASSRATVSCSGADRDAKEPKSCSCSQVSLRGDAVHGVNGDGANFSLSHVRARFAEGLPQELSVSALMSRRENLGLANVASWAARVLASCCCLKARLHVEYHRFLTELSLREVKQTAGQSA